MSALFDWALLGTKPCESVECSLWTSRTVAAGAEGRALPCLVAAARKAKSGS